MTQQFVAQYYRMDPVSEVLLYGWELMDGMEVLIESAAHRADLNVYNMDSSPLQPDKLPDYVEDEALRMNRWAKVTKFAVDSEYDKQLMHFVAEYEDGTQKVQSWELYVGWLVKKDSIPEDYRTPNAEQTKSIVMNGEGIANEWCRRQGLKMVPVDAVTAEKVVEAMDRAAAGLKRDMSTEMLRRHFLGDAQAAATWVDEVEKP